jgi:hypothetical protein
MGDKMSKQKRAVIVGLEKNDGGNLRITLDDLIQQDSGSSKWIKDDFITFKEYDVQTFEELDFNDKDLADFGYMIISRLFAFYKQGEI